MKPSVFSSRPRAAIAGLLAASLFSLGGFATARAQVPQSWLYAGADLSNSHASNSPATPASPTRITPATASKLRLKWAITLSGGVSATPTVEPGGLYVPDWGGSLYKINPATGAIIWSHHVKDYTNLYGSMSRSSPAIGTTNIVIGDGWPHTNVDTATPGALVIAVNKTTGNLAWKTRVDSTSQWSQILGSPMIYNGLVYVGTASWEEFINPDDPTFKPTFRGTLTALNVNTGAIVWQKYMAPNGYTGVAIPGSAPVVWPAGNAVIVSTGNNYTIPPAVGACVFAAFPKVTPMYACEDPTNYVNSTLAFDLTTGKLLWSRQFGGPDNWNQSCSSTDPGAVTANCPYPYPAPDFDFASQPNLITVPNLAGKVDDRGGVSIGQMLTIGQKSGSFRALNPTNGGKYWETRVGYGGIEWGSAINTMTGSSAYVALDNFQHNVNYLAGQYGNGVSANGGAWSALNLLDGTFNWQIPTWGQDLVTPAYNGYAPGAVAFSNGVMFGGSSSGVFSAVDTTTGYYVWTYNNPLDIHGGASIFNDTVYWGAGYKTVPPNQPTLYAFAIPSP